jgi:hypothetical protein
VAKQTSFNLEDAKVLQDRLGELYLTWQEWQKVESHWTNLKSVWKDEQFDKFEPLFEKLSTTYNKALEECHQYRGFLAQQIQIAEEKRLKLGELFDKGMTVLQAGVSLLGTNATPVQNPLSSAQQPTSSYVQRADPNSCSLNDKQNLEQSSADQGYDSLPGIARVMDFEEQLEEVHSQDKEKEAERRKREEESKAIADKQTSISGSPPDPKAEFAKSLKYETQPWDRSENGSQSLYVATRNKNHSDPQ